MCVIPLTGRGIMKRFALVCTVVLCSFLIACNIPLGSYPRFWDFARTRPKDADVAGTYRIVKLRIPSELRHLVRERDAQITLKADHTAVFVDIPVFDGSGEKLICELSGSARWELDKSFDWYVVFENYHASPKPAEQGCKYENSAWDFFTVLSHHAPYRLYEYVGDPDSDTGLEFGRSKQ
jgi:hypothetical protein